MAWSLLLPCILRIPFPHSSIPSPNSPNPLLLSSATQIHAPISRSRLDSLSISPSFAPPSPFSNRSVKLRLGSRNLVILDQVRCGSSLASRAIKAMTRIQRNTWACLIINSFRFLGIMVALMILFSQTMSLPNFSFGRCLYA